MNSYEQVLDGMKARRSRWLITGAAGFIGSNLLESLLSLDQEVVGIDDFSTGFRANLEQVRDAVSAAEWQRFRFVEGDIRDLETCREACAGVEYVLHQAALGSVPRSVDDPITSNAVNVGGTLNMLVAARDAGVSRFVYAASSAAYGDDAHLPKVEDRIGRPLSPYAVTKYANELYAGVFQRVYGLESIGLRYFNVFGKRQDPDGAYAAVIPAWIGALLRGSTCQIYGDGETSRDFTYVENAVQANLLAAFAPADATDRVYNVACGERTTLNYLFGLLRDGLAAYHPEIRRSEPVYADFRPGDVRHSQADIELATRHLGFRPTHFLAEGLAEALPWYVGNLAAVT